MNFYNILWISIFALGGISLGILGMADLNLLSLFLINPRIFNRLILDAESIYLYATLTHYGGKALEIQNI